MTGSGTVIPTISAGGALDAAANTNTASTGTDNTVLFDITAPTVTINQATPGSFQSDPTSASPVNFKVAFTESVTGFTGADVTIAGTAPGTKTATVTGSGTTYNVAISGMTGSGTVIPTIPAGGAADLAGNLNTASTGTDNSILYNDTTPPVVTITSFTATGGTVTASGTAGLSPGDSDTVTVVICTQSNMTCASPVATLTTTRNPTTGAWTVTSTALGTRPTLYARAKQTDLAGSTGTSPAAGPISIP
jgi:hypothetical protein